MKKLFAILALIFLCATGVQAAAKKSPAKPAKAPEKSEAREAPTSAKDADSEPQTAAAKSARSGKAGSFGIGADLRASLLTRYWISSKLAFDAALGLGEMNFTSGFFWIPEVRAGIAYSVATIPVGIGSMPFYMGGGVGFRPFIASAFGWGISVYGAVGFNFIPAKAPIDIFAEIRPTIGISDSVWFGGFPLGFGSTAVGLSFVPTAGLRYYF